MKLRCAILDDYQQVALTSADWSQVMDKVEVKVIDRHIDDQEELLEQIADCEIIVIMRERTPFRASLLAQLPRLKLLITTGMRNASVDMTAAASKGVIVCGTGGAGNATAELTWSLILGLARNIVFEHNAIRSGQWQSTIGTDLYGKTLGVLGLGKLGSKIAKFGQAFGMDVMAWSQNLTKERAGVTERLDCRRRGRCVRSGAFTQGRYVPIASESSHYTAYRLCIESELCGFL